MQHFPIKKRFYSIMYIFCDAERQIVISNYLPLTEPFWFRFYSYYQPTQFFVALHEQKSVSVNFCYVVLQLQSRHRMNRWITYISMMRMMTMDAGVESLFA